MSRGHRTHQADTRMQDGHAPWRGLGAGTGWVASYGHVRGCSGWVGESTEWVMEVLGVMVRLWDVHWAQTREQRGRYSAQSHQVV
eukprot:358961-Chlamydomonas_euryale.AAC.6